MKTPRVQDFDPDAKTPTLGSPLDGMPVIEKPNKQLEQLKPSITERPNGRTPVESLNRTPERVKKRIITRNSFELYEDQMDSLRKLAFEDKMDGKLGSMSAMVREAIDTYLEKRKKK
jgi:hypothetical protein